MRQTLHLAHVLPDGRALLQVLRPGANWRPGRHSAPRATPLHSAIGRSVYGVSGGGRHAEPRRGWLDRGLLRLLVGRSGIGSRILVAGSVLMLLAFGPLLLAFQSLAHASSVSRRGPPIIQAASTGAVMAMEVAAVQVPPPAPPFPIPVAPVSASVPVITIASWYPGRPEACYQQGRRMALPAGLTLWTASKTLPCGSRIEVSGPAGKVELLVEDRGPYMGPSRDLDLSPPAFRKVAGPLGIGTAVVRYRVITPVDGTT